MAGAFNATLTRVKIGGTAVAKETTSTLSVSSNNFETTSKDSGGWRELAYGLREATITMEGNIDFAATTGYETIMNAFLNRTVLTVEFGTTVTGDEKYSGSFLVESLEQNDDMEDVATFTATLALSGALTAATV